ncbi:TonB-dependent receptor [candidate division KSB1 bacterium]|nr:TonB-dependent receptor [candidate division KSB1 bacterium]
MKFKFIFILWLILIGHTFPNQLGSQSAAAKKAKPPAEPRLDVVEILPDNSEAIIPAVNFRLTPRPDSARSFPLTPHYLPQQLPPDSVARTIPEKPRLSRTGFLKYRFGCGNLNALDLDVVRGQKSQRLEYLVGVQYFRTDGSYAQSQKEKYTLAGQVDYRLSSRLRFVSDLQYQRENYELQASPIAQHQRRTNLYLVSGKLPFQFSPNPQASLMINLTRFQLKEKAAAPLPIPTARESMFELRGKYLWRATRWSLISDFKAFFNFYQPRPDSTIEDFGLQWKGQWRYRFRPHLTWTIGGQLENIAFADGVSRTRLSPLTQINFVYRNVFGFLLQFSREFDYTAFRILSQKNPYLKVPAKLNLGDFYYRVLFELELKLHAKLQLQSQFKYQDLRQGGYFLPVGYLFDYLYFDKVSQSIMRHTIFWQPYTALQLQAFTQLNFYKITDAALQLNRKIAPPFQEKLSAGLGLKFRPRPSTRLQLDGHYFGSRYTTVDYRQELKPYLRIDLTLEKQFNEYITLFITGNNLLNQKYSLWTGYREPGINVIGGIKGRW